MNPLMPRLCVLILFSLGISSTLSVEMRYPGQYSHVDGLEGVKAILDTVVNKNKELDRRVERLEKEREGQKLINENLMDRFHKLVTKQRVDSNSNVQAREKDNTRMKDQNVTTSTIPMVQNGVAFTARLVNDITGLGQGQSIEFDNVVTNVGGGFRKSRGVFTAPKDGVYVFTLTAMARPGQFENLEIVKDGIYVAEVFVGTPGTHPYEHSSTGVVTLSLSKGNEVWVETPNIPKHGTGSLQGGSETSFSGWLLF